MEAKDHGNINIINPTCIDSDAFHSLFYLSCGDKLCGIIYVADELHDNAKSTIDHFKQDGIKKIILLSGDRDEVVKNVAKKLGIDEAYGGVLPDAKLKKYKSFKSKVTRWQ